MIIMLSRRQRGRAEEVAGPSLALTTKLHVEFFLGRPYLNSLVMLVNSQLICLLLT